MNVEDTLRLESLHKAISFFFNNDLLDEDDFQEALNQIIICHYGFVVLE